LDPRFRRGDDTTVLNSLLYFESEINRRTVMEGQRNNQSPDPNPSYRCERTAEPGICLKFYRNPRNGLYDLPPGGERVDCANCLYFFE
jgi:hypothetical protein